ncbi:MAG: hypothetical protein L6V81_11230 [Clostridium sp.]|nr:MAG: hypothetical protein L6V81_11230 [Clostridium sp.]
MRQKDYSNKQQELQNEQTQLAIDEINQQKDKLEKDYIKEQKKVHIAIGKKRI